MRKLLRERVSRRLDPAGFVYLQWPAFGPSRLLFLVFSDGRCDFSLTAEEVAGGDRPAVADVAVSDLVSWMRAGRPTCAPQGWRVVREPPAGARFLVPC